MSNECRQAPAMVPEFLFERMAEKGLESLIMRHMTGTDCLASGAAGVAAEAVPAKGGSRWFAGRPAAYDREFAMDTK